METNERRQIEQECRNLINRLAQYSDRMKKKESSELFTAEGTWVRAGVAYKGRAAIIDSFKNPETEILRHLTGSVVIDVENEERARGLTYYLLFRHDPATLTPQFPLPLGQPFSMGEWHDTFARTEQGWRIAFREVRRMFQK